jgi:hypothetical protein
MARAWPFERKGEPERPFHAPEDFVIRQPPPVDAVVVRIGLHDAQLVLVDRDGRWERWVYPSVEGARGVAERLGVSLHEGHYPEELRVRMNSYVRPAEDFERGAYGEQGRVGPVIPYPENRPRPRERPPQPEDELSEEFRRRHPGLA